MNAIVLRTALPCLRPGNAKNVFVVCCWRSLPLEISFFLLQELSKQRVVKLVSPASCADQQSFVA